MNKEQREKAIAWLTEEIRSLELAPELNGRPMTQGWAEQLEIMRTCLEAVQLSDFAEVSKQAEREYYAGFSSNTAHIDREAWTAEWEEDGECDHKPYRVRSAEKWKKYKCSKCGYKAGRRTSQKYCPSCGKAMTPEAWAELENRLRG